MDILETQTSRENQFIELVQKHYPKAEVYRQANGQGLGFATPERFFETGKRMFTVYRKGREAWLFKDGVWMPIDIYVYDKQFFDLAKAIAKDYSDATGKPARIIKEF